MMKPSDISVATALLIQGYMRANGETDEALEQAISAILHEAGDWAENRDHALASIQVAIAGPHTPFNLRTAIAALFEELRDIQGDDEVRRVANEILAQLS